MACLFHTCGPAPYLACRFTWYSTSNYLSHTGHKSQPPHGGNPSHFVWAHNLDTQPHSSSLSTWLPMTAPHDCTTATWRNLLTRYHKPTHGYISCIQIRCTLNQKLFAYVFPIIERAVPHSHGLPRRSSGLRTASASVSGSDRWHHVGSPHSSACGSSLWPSSCGKTSARKGRKAEFPGLGKLC